MEAFDRLLIVLNCALPNDTCGFVAVRSPFLAHFRSLWLKASRLKLAAKAVELGGSRLLLKEKKFSRAVARS